MNPTLALLLLAVFLANASAKCHRTFNLTKSFCANPPTANLDLHAFTGVWFQTFLTTDTDPFQTNICTTAEYTRQTDASIRGLNCEFAPFLTRPRCLGDVITRRPGGGPGGLLVTAGPMTANLNFVALLGLKSYGYFAAAAFQCNRVDPVTPGYFILARKPFLTRKVLHRLKKKLRCLGFPLPKAMDFVETQVMGCKYFFGKDGFDLVSPEDLMNR